VSRRIQSATIVTQSDLTQVIWLAGSLEPGANVSGKSAENNRFTAYQIALGTGRFEFEVTAESPGVVPQLALYGPRDRTGRYGEAIAVAANVECSLSATLPASIKRAGYYLAVFRDARKPPCPGRIKPCSDAPILTAARLIPAPHKRAP